MATTAQYRELAKEAEKKLDWELAVSYWRKALEVYPNTPGELAEVDKDKILSAINADMEMIVAEIDP